MRRNPFNDHPLMEKVKDFGAHVTSGAIPGRQLSYRKLALAVLMLIFVLGSYVNFHFASSYNIKTTNNAAAPSKQKFFTGVPSTASREEELAKLDVLPMTMTRVDELLEYNVGPHLQYRPTLEDLIEEKAKNKEGYIPNIVHFVVLHSVRSVWSTPAFTMMQYMCIRAAYLRLRPKAIIVHYDVEPTGSYWELIKPYIIPIQVQQVPRTIFGRRIVQVEHMSDIIRMRALLKYGGVYMDTDVLSVRNFESLREGNSFILGNETYTNGESHWICNAVILSQNHSPFLKRWYESYATFNYNIWSEHSAVIPDALARKYPNESTIVHNKYFFRPIHDPEGIKNLYVKDEYDFSENYAVHMWRSMQHKRMNKFNMAKAITAKMSLSRVLRPVLPHPFISAVMEIPPNSHMGIVHQLRATLSSVDRQSFPLHEVVLVDNSDGSLPDNWSNSLQRIVAAFPKMLFRVVPGKDGTSPKNPIPNFREKDSGYVRSLIRNDNDPLLKGAWRIDVSIGEHLDHDLFEKFMEELEGDVSKFHFTHGNHSMNYIYAIPR